MGLMEQARGLKAPTRCPKCNLPYPVDTITEHLDNSHCFQRVGEREIYRKGWIKLSDLPEWETPPPRGGFEDENGDYKANLVDDWWPRRVVQAFNARHGKGAIMLRANPRVGYTQHWVRIWAIQVLMERMAGADRDPDAARMTVDEGVALLKAYHDAFQGEAIPEDLLRPDEIAVHLAGKTPIPDWWNFGWFCAWADLPNG